MNGQHESQGSIHHAGGLVAPRYRLVLRRVAAVGLWLPVLALPAMVWNGGEGAAPGVEALVGRVPAPGQELAAFFGAYPGRVEACLVASVARYLALGGHYTGRYKLTAQAGADRSGARTAAREAAPLNLERSLAASTARWAALGKAYCTRDRAALLVSVAR
jgi:hypothetical protein